MKKVFFLVFILSFIVAKADVETFDSISYAYGDVSTRAYLADYSNIYEDLDINNVNEKDSLIKGILDNIPDKKYTQDSVNYISFALGIMQGVFFFDAYEHSRTKEKVPLNCILDGLKKVINDELTLPDDTIRINEYMNSLDKELEPTDLPEDERCKFFTYYGIMKGYQPGLQDYIYEQTGKDDVPANQKAYAAGFAMVLNSDLNNETPSAAYNLGRIVAFSVLSNPLPFNFDENSFIEGCRAAVGLSERKLSIDEAENILHILNKEEFSSDTKENIIVTEKVEQENN